MGRHRSIAPQRLPTVVDCGLRREQSWQGSSCTPLLRQMFGPTWPVRGSPRQGTLADAAVDQQRTCESLWRLSLGKRQSKPPSVANQFLHGLNSLARPIARQEFLEKSLEELVKHERRLSGTALAAGSSAARITRHRWLAPFRSTSQSKPCRTKQMIRELFRIDATDSHHSVVERRLAAIRCRLCLNPVRRSSRSRSGMKQCGVA